MSHQIEATDMPTYAIGVSNQFYGASFADVLGRCNPLMTQSIRDNFTSSASWDNISWPARKIQGDGHPLLIDTGKLLQAATGGGAGSIMTISDRELKRGVNSYIVPYAAIHQHGSRPSNPRKMPARPYLGPKPEHVDACAELIADYVMQFFVGVAA